MDYKRIAIMLGVIFVVVGGGYLLFWERTPNIKDLPLIKAEPGPTKFRPANAGQTNVPHQNMLIYKRLADDDAPKVEKLNPPPSLAEVKKVEKIKVLAPKSPVQLDTNFIPIPPKRRLALKVPYRTKK